MTAEKPALLRPSDTPPLPGLPGNRGLRQAYKLRDLAAEEAMALREEPMIEGRTRASRAGAIVALIRAWDVASDRVRKLRGRPLPGSQRPAGKPPSVKRAKVAPAPSLASLSTLKTPSEGQPKE